MTDLGDTTTATTTRILQGLSELLEAVQQAPSRRAGPSLNEALSAHLGVPAAQRAVIREEVPGHRYVDVDIALAEITGRDPDASVIGVGGGDMRYHHSLGDLVEPGRFGPGSAPVGQVDYQNLACGPDAERAVVSYGVRLFRYGPRSVPLAVLQRRASPRYGRDMGGLEILSAADEVVGPFLDEVRRLAIELSVVRGQVVSLSSSGFESTTEGMTFIPRPSLSAADVILPEGTLGRIEDQVVGVAEHSERLRAYGQHLKRGVLLYGPPGTGKTHTVRYLLSRTEGHTVVLLAGDTLRFVSFAAQLARALQPAIVVLEDCDLVAEERGMHGGPKPLLFEVLDAMDGLSADADVTFLLTTNRVDTLERALAQRPGRVDLAVEIPMPDGDGRRRLLALYSPAGVFSDQAIAEVAERTARTTASFARELVRRAVVAATLAGEEPGDGHLRAAADTLMSDGERLSRSLLGNGSEAGTPWEAGALGLGVAGFGPARFGGPKC